ARALRQGFVYEGQYSRFRGRSHGRPLAPLSGRQLVGYLQNHDQVGNRARGDRLSALISAQRCRAAAALLLTAPFIPLVFQGEEWGTRAPFPYFCDHQDPDLVRAVREGRQREFAAFGWRAEDIPDPQAPATFAAARLCWEERSAPEHAAMLAWYRTLIALRRAEPDLNDGRLDRCRVRADGRGWLVMTRGAITVACNFAADGQRVELDAADGETAAILAAVGDADVSAHAVALGPDAAVILRR
ncbi:MAG: DUF3459 domain-containing protein, partial [Gemmatimonadales bacterium]